MLRKFFTLFKSKTPIMKRKPNALPFPSGKIIVVNRRRIRTKGLISFENKILNQFLSFSSELKLRF